MTAPHDPAYEAAANDLMQERIRAGTWKGVFDFCSVSCACSLCMLGDYLVNRYPVQGRVSDGSHAG